MGAGNRPGSGFLPKMGQNSNKTRAEKSEEKGKMRLEKIREIADSGGIMAGESQGKISEDDHSGSEHRNFFRILSVLNEI